MTQPCPKGYHTVTPSLMFKDTRKAIEFYKKAFGAQEKGLVLGSGGGVAHAEIFIGNSILMMGDEMPAMPSKSAETYGHSPVAFYLYFDDCDAAFKQAVAAGAKVIMPLQDMFWGDRLGVVQDPFGYAWNVATHKKDPTPEEIKKGAESMFAAAQ
jgi:PhnB protein